MSKKNMILSNPLTPSRAPSSIPVLEMGEYGLFRVRVRVFRPPLTRTPSPTLTLSISRHFYWLILLSFDIFIFDRTRMVYPRQYLLLIQQSGMEQETEIGEYENICTNIWNREKKENISTST